MAPPYGHRTSIGALALTFLSCFACIYVAGRLWFTTRELHYVRNELVSLEGRRSYGDYQFPTLNSPGSQKSQDSTLHYSVRPHSGPGTVLNGRDVGTDLPTQPADDNLVGQIDAVEAGVVTGWACSRGQDVKPLKVHVYVDNIKVGQVVAEEATPHHVVHRLCQLDTRFNAGQDQAGVGVGFKLRLPELKEGKHELRAFVVNPAGSAKQELNQSPLAFVETKTEPGMQEALKRKDSIIRVRNAQVAALWEELHTRQPWRNALDSPSFVDLPGSAAQNASRALVVFGINTGIGARPRRDTLRKTWVPTGDKLRALEKRGIYIRFVIGYSEQKDDPEEVRLQKEMKEFNDILRIDITDSYADLTGKTLKLFAVLPLKIEADFYFKVDDDVAVNIDAMEYYLTQQRSQGNLYMGCMKSGQVLTDRRYKWFEPEFWRFGDPASDDGEINYMRHASGQIYGLSGQVARYISNNHPILHRYANEDISVGAWLLGLDVSHVDERRFCCDSEEKCKAQSSKDNLCLSYYEHQCAGICSSEQRLEAIWQGCLDRPLEKGATDIPQIPEGQTKNYYKDGVEDERRL